jgi:hypothetical protein
VNKRLHLLEFRLDENILTYSLVNPWNNTWLGWEHIATRWIFLASDYDAPNATDDALLGVLIPREFAGRMVPGGRVEPLNP